MFNRVLVLFCGLSGTASVPLVKAVNASGRIDQLLLARKERVACRANFYVKFLTHGRACLKNAAAGTRNCDLVVIRVYICFHNLFLSPYISDAWLDAIFNNTSEGAGGQVNR